MGFVYKQLVGAKLLFFSFLGQPVDLLLGELQMTTKNSVWEAEIFYAEVLLPTGRDC